MGNETETEQTDLGQDPEPLRDSRVRAFLDALAQGAAAAVLRSSPL